jgi:hypothetical protein
MSNGHTKQTNANKEWSDGRAWKLLVCKKISKKHLPEQVLQVKDNET